MRLLLDSQVLIWWMGEPEKLKSPARVAISDRSNLVFASVASIWEIGLKASKGKLRLPLEFHQQLPAHGIAIVGG